MQEIHNLESFGKRSSSLAKIDGLTIAGRFNDTYDDDDNNDHVDEMSSVKNLAQARDSLATATGLPVSALPKSKSLNRIANSSLTKGVSRVYTVSSQSTGLSSVVELGEFAATASNKPSHHVNNDDDDDDDEDCLIAEFRTTDRVNDISQLDDTIDWVSNSDNESVKSQDYVPKQKAVQAQKTGRSDEQFNYSSDEDVFCKIYHRPPVTLVHNESSYDESYEEDRRDDDTNSVHEMEYELVNDLIENELNRIRIESKHVTDWSSLAANANNGNQNVIENNAFGTLVYIIETYNKIIVTIYKPELFAADAEFKEIEIEQLLNSLLNNGQHDDKNVNVSCCFERVILNLLRVLFFLDNVLDDLTLFGLPAETFFVTAQVANAPRDNTTHNRHNPGPVVNSILKESKVISTELLAFYQIKAPAGRVAGDKANYLTPFGGGGAAGRPLLDSKAQLLAELNRTESVNGLSLASKLLLCQLLLNQIMEHTCHLRRHLGHKHRVDELTAAAEKLRDKLGSYPFQRIYNADQIKTEIKQIERELKRLSRIEPFGRLDVSDREFSFYFWHLNCMPLSLVVEKRFHIINANEPRSDNANEMESKTTEVAASTSSSAASVVTATDELDFVPKFVDSQWFVIDDPSQLSSLYEVISANSTDSKLVNGILAISDMIDEDNQIAQGSDEKKAFSGGSKENSQLLKKAATFSHSSACVDNGAAESKSKISSDLIGLGLSYSLSNLRRLNAMQRAKCKPATVDSKLNEIEDMATTSATDTVQTPRALSFFQVISFDNFVLFSTDKWEIQMKIRDNKTKSRQNPNKKTINKLNPNLDLGNPNTKSARSEQ
jgi:hypothetical protein